MCKKSFSYDYAADPSPKLVFFSDPYSVNLARPLAKGFEQLRPGVIGFSQGRRHGKVEIRPFALSSSRKKKRRKVMLMQWVHSRPLCFSL